MYDYLGLLQTSHSGERRHSRMDFIIAVQGSKYIACTSVEMCYDALN